MNRFVPSPGVRRMLALRMDASVGTPTLLQKIAARLGFGAAIGMTPAEIASTLAGENADVTKGEQDLLNLFTPILHTGEADGLSDLQAFLTAELSAGIPTSVASAVSTTKAALATASASAQSQAASLGETAFTTLVSAVLSSLGHTSLPAA